MTIRDDNHLATDPGPAPPRAEEADPKRFMPPGTAPAVDGGMEALFPHDEVGQLKSKWSSLQIRFVDEPRRSVEEADGLVAATIRQLADTLSDERAKLEAQWAESDEVSTEDLRLAMQRYRSFLDRLVSAYRRG